MIRVSPVRSLGVGLVALIGAGSAVVACGGESAAPTTSGRSTSTTAPARSSIPRWTVQVEARHPHDPTSFTQGLTFTADGRLFESRGLYGQSSVAELSSTDGSVIAARDLDPALFGEGLAAGPSGLVQLTWKEGEVLRWSTDLVASPGWQIDGEGWGVAWEESSKRFVTSDGSATLTFRNPDTFAATDRVEVTRAGAPVRDLNELEVVGDRVWANVWHSDEILRIDPATGMVDGVIDAAALWTDPERSSEMVLNGIAHAPGDPDDRVWLTGKLWPELFEVRMVPE